MDANAARFGEELGDNAGGAPDLLLDVFAINDFDARGFVRNAAFVARNICRP